MQFTMCIIKHVPTTTKIISATQGLQISNFLYPISMQEYVQTKNYLKTNCIIDTVHKIIFITTAIDKKIISLISIYYTSTIILN
jgi:hypothetical protein